MGKNYPDCPVYSNSRFAEVHLITYVVEAIHELPLRDFYVCTISI